MVHHLTDFQRKVLKYCTEFYERNRYPAIVSDITHDMQVSISKARSCITTLARYGYVDWIVERRRTRAIFPLWKE